MLSNIVEHSLLASRALLRVSRVVEVNVVGEGFLELALPGVKLLLVVGVGGRKLREDVALGAFLHAGPKLLELVKHHVSQGALHCCKSPQVQFLGSLKVALVLLKVQGERDVERSLVLPNASPLHVLVDESGVADEAGVLNPSILVGEGVATLIGKALVSEEALELLDILQSAFVSLNGPRL